MSPAGTRARPGRDRDLDRVSDRQYAPALAFDGTNYLVVWADYRSGTSCDIYGARVSPAGRVLDPAGIAISTAADDQSAPALAFDGTNYLVVWQDSRSRHGLRRLRRAGQPGGDACSTRPGSRSRPRRDNQHGTGARLRRHELPRRLAGLPLGHEPDIYGARVSPAGTVLDPSGIPISTAANSQSSPALAFDGTNYLVAWQDDRTGTSSRRLRRAREPGRDGARPGRDPDLHSRKRVSGSRI